MPTLREVKKRIKSVRSTRRITGAMEMVAAAKLRRSQQRVEQARPYARKMEEMLRHLAAASTGEIVHPFFEQREIKRRTLVVITSDRGFCGSFNANIIRRATQWFDEHQGVQREFVVVGKKGNDFFKRRPQYQVLRYYGDWGGTLDYSRARSMVSLLTERFGAGETDQIDLLYTRYISTVKYELTMERYLPIERPELTGEGQGHGPTLDYIFEPNPEAIYAALMPGYATTKLVVALAESFASEHGSRMIAMNNATKNAGEMITGLTLQFNKARQAQITTELLEVVSGAEALKG